MWRVWLKRVAIAIVAVFLVFVLGFVPYWLAGLATTRRFQFPDKENANLTPASFELAFEEVAFRAADGIELKGWWVPAAARPRHRRHGARPQPLADRDGEARALRPLERLERDARWTCATTGRAAERRRPSA